MVSKNPMIMLKCVALLFHNKNERNSLKIKLYTTPVQIDKNNLDADKIYNRLKIGGNVQENVLIDPHKVQSNRIWVAAEILEF